LWCGPRPDLLLFLGEHESFADFLELASGQEIERSAELLMETSERVLVCRVAEVPRCVKGLLDAKLVVQGINPLLIRLGDELPHADGQYVLVIVKLVRIETEELEQKLGL
jgi:hypothetical protein